LPVTVVVGGQYGSEGKGKLVSHLACVSSGEVATVRCGGSNAGHTAVGNGKTYRLRQLPSGVVANECRLFLAPGMLLDLDVLWQEIWDTNVSAERLRVDRNAAVISAADRQEESRIQLGARLGSTLTGTGVATARKVLRDPDVKLASAVPRLGPYLADVSYELNDLLDHDARVIVEGTQGFGLSLHHSSAYPYVTSRDTTAAAFLSEAGLSPLQVDEIVLVLRTFPIRVAGNSGPLAAELSWEEVAKRAGYPNSIAEYTTVTRRLRRVGEFDWDLARRAVMVNRPTLLAIHGADYLSYSDLGATDWESLSSLTRNFIQLLEDELDVSVGFIFTGPGEAQIIERTSRLRGASTDYRQAVGGRR
jgi:adenylosuccinate synthase